MGKQKESLSKKENRLYIACFAAVFLFCLAVFGKDMWQNRAAYKVILYGADKVALLMQVLVFLFLVFLFYLGWKKRLSLKEYFKTYPIVPLLLLVTVSVCVAFAPFIEGRRFFIFYDASLDTQEEYVPIIAAVIRRLKEGNFSTWVSEWGFGCDIFNNQSLVFDPFNLPLYLIGVITNLNIVAYFLAIMQIVKIFCTGIFSYLFLKEHQMPSMARVITAYICSLNGFLMLWGQHYFFGSAVALVFLDFWLIERVLRGKRTMPGLAAAVGLTAAFSLYCTYMIALFALVYVFLHFLLEENTKDRGRRFLRFFIPCLIGMGLSCFIALPASYQLLTVSARIGGSESTSVSALLAQGLSQWKGTLRIALARMFSNNLLGNGSNYGTNYYEAPQLFLSSFFPTAAGIWFSENVFFGKKKARSLSAALVLAFLAFCPVAALVFNMFSAIFWRYLFVLLPAAALILAWALGHLEELHGLSVVIGAVCAALSLFIILRYHGATTAHLEYFCCAIVILFLIAVVFIRYSSKMKWVGWIFIAGISVCSMTRDAFLSNCDRHTYNRGSQVSIVNFGTLEPQAFEAMDELCAGKAVRTESVVSGFSMYNNALIYGNEGVSFYNTSSSSYIKQFILKEWGTLIPQGQVSGFSSYIGGYQNIESASLAGVRYVLAQQGDLTGVENGFNLVEDLGNGYGIYENIYAGERAILFSDWISEEDFEKLPAQQAPNVFWNTVVLNDSNDSPDPEGLEESALSLQDAQQRPSEPDYYKKNGVSFTKESSSRLTAQVDTDTEKLLFISNPWDKGWTAYVNGKRTQVYRADYGFMAIQVPAGESSVELVYHTPLKKEGTAVSAVSFAAYLLYTYFDIKREKKKNRKRKASTHR